MLRAGFDLHEVDTRRSATRLFAALDVTLHVLRPERQRGKPVVRTARRSFAHTDHASDDAEIERRGVAQRRSDDDIVGRELRELLPGAALDENGQHLVGDHRSAGELLTGQERSADVHHDEDVHAHGTRNINRQVVGDSTVHQQATLTLHGREDARRGQTCAHGARQVARADDDGIARLEIGRHGTKRSG